MRNGGEAASRGFIFQAITALIECLDPDNDWDRIKNEPKTDEDKVDIILYKGGRIKTAIQVKSSINAFERADVKKWLESLKRDAEGAEKICLCLVGDAFTLSCEHFIKENPGEIKRVPFEHLQSISTGKLIGYINRAGLGEKVRVSDLELISAGLFSELLGNSIAIEPVSRRDFEAAFRRAIPREEELAERISEAVSGLVHKEPFVPECLTPVPLINKEKGLVGREDIVREIRKKLDEDTCIVLVNGLGGIGKTAVMQGICSELREEGRYVAWIRCGDSLRDDLLMLRDGLGIPKEEKADEAYGAVKAGIQRLGRKLYLFMDDLSREVSREERDVINALGVHVMITSRTESLPFYRMKLEHLDDRDAVKMFYGYYGGKPRREETVRKIIGSVKSHTLLVELLAKAAKEEGGTLEEFCEKLEEGFFDVSEEEYETEHDDGERTIEESVIRLYGISGLSEEQQRIMKLFTVFSPEKEIYFRIRDWAGFDRKEMKKLSDLGWLERGGLENGYQIHQIVRDSIARQMKNKDEQVSLEDYGELLERIIDTESYLGRETTYEKVRERLVLAEDTAGFIEKTGREDAAAGALFNNMAEVYYRQGDYKKALDFYGKALAIRKRVLGEDHPDTAATYNNMAVIFYDRGDYEKALDYYGKALTVSRHVLGEDHPDTAATYSNMAGLYKARGKYEKAQEYYEKALSINGRVLGEDHPAMAVLYNNMALVFSKQGIYGKALEYSEKALAIDRHVQGADSSAAAATYSNMAAVFYAQGDYGKALEYYGKALAIRERVLGPGHPDTASAYSGMAGVCYVQGDYDEALEYYRKALAIRERVLGEDHHRTAVTYNNMAGVFCAQGDYGRALTYYEKAYAVYLSKMGESHPYTQSMKRSIVEMESMLG